MSNINKLKEIESICYGLDPKDYLLWPNTPIATKDIQEKIKQRFGVEDSINHENSRPSIIIKNIKKLLNENKLDNNFEIIDICCGDGIILSEVNNQFNNSKCYGFDINKNKFESHFYLKNVTFFYGFIQELINFDFEKKFEITMMLNTYRDWNAAQVSKNFPNLERDCTNWLIKNSKFIFLTVNNKQLEFFRNNFKIEILGSGEEDSTFILIHNF